MIYQGIKLNIEEFGLTNICGKKISALFFADIGKRSEGIFPMRCFMCSVAKDFLNLGVARCIKVFFLFFTAINCAGIKKAIFLFNYCMFDVLPRLQGAS